jgi:anti-sigma B factor antagonist
MELAVEQLRMADGIAAIKVAGALDHRTDHELRSVIIELVNSGYYKLIVDLDFIDSNILASHAMGVLVGGLKRTRAHDGFLKLVINRVPLIRQLSYVGLRKMFGFFSTIEEAIGGAGFEGIPTATTGTSNSPIPGTCRFYFPARTYTAKETSDIIAKRLPSLVEAFGMTLVYKLPIGQDPRFRKYTILMDDPGGSYTNGYYVNWAAAPTVVQQLTLVGLALQRKAIESGSALNLSLEQDGVVSKMLSALNETSGAIIQIGPVIFVKVREATAVRWVDGLEEDLLVMQYPEFHRDPETALRILTESR